MNERFINTQTLKDKYLPTLHHGKYFNDSGLVLVLTQNSSILKLSNNFVVEHRMNGRMLSIEWTHTIWACSHLNHCFLYWFLYTQQQTDHSLDILSDHSGWWDNAFLLEHNSPGIVCSTAFPQSVSVAIYEP